MRSLDNQNPTLIMMPLKSGAEVTLSLRHTLRGKSVNFHLFRFTKGLKAYIYKENAISIVTKRFKNDIVETSLADPAVHWVENLIENQSSF